MYGTLPKEEHGRLEPRLIRSAPLLRPEAGLERERFRHLRSQLDRLFFRCDRGGVGLSIVQTLLEEQLHHTVRALCYVTHRHFMQRFNVWCEDCNQRPM